MLTQSVLLKENFEERQTQIEALVSDEDLDDEYAERADFEDRLSAACARSQKLINVKESVTPIAPSFRDSNNTDNRNRETVTPSPPSQNNEQSPEVESEHTTQRTPRQHYRTIVVVEIKKIMLQT